MLTQKDIAERQCLFCEKSKQDKDKKRGKNLEVLDLNTIFADSQINL